jgi:hypothetical protein
MIRKSGRRFSEKIMLQQKVRAPNRFNLKRLCSGRPMMHQRGVILSTGLAAVFLVCASFACAAQKSAPRASEGSCRQAVNGLISLLDAKNDGTALYRDTYAVVVGTCGPPAGEAESQRGAPPGRVACHDLAAALVDLIEDGRMNSRAFVETRDRFAQTCPPR